MKPLYEILELATKYHKAFENDKDLSFRKPYGMCASLNRSLVYNEITPLEYQAAMDHIQEHLDVFHTDIKDYLVFLLTELVDYSYSYDELSFMVWSATIDKLKYDINPSLCDSHYIY